MSRSSRAGPNSEGHARSGLRASPGRACTAPRALVVAYLHNLSGPSVRSCHMIHHDNATSASGKLGPAIHREVRSRAQQCPVIPCPFVPVGCGCGSASRCWYTIGIRTQHTFPLSPILCLPCCCVSVEILVCKMETLS